MQMLNLRRTTMIMVVVLLPWPTWADEQRPADARTPAPGSEERWEVLRLGGRDMGYSRLQQRPIVVSGGAGREIDSLTMMRVKRFGQTVTQSMRIVSRETRAGELVEFSSQLGDGADQLTVQGTVAGKQMRLNASTGTQRSEQTIDWDGSNLSPFAVERLLQDAPPQDDEIREFRMFMPIYNQVVDATLQADGRESTRLLEGTQVLRKFTSKMSFPSGQTLVSTIWTDEQGEIWKTRVEGVGQESLRADRARALQAAFGELDLGVFTVVRVSKLPANFPHVPSATYRVELAESDPSKVLLANGRQQVRRIGPHEAQLTVTRAADAFVTSSDRPAYSPADLAASALVQTDDSGVRELADSVSPGEQDKRVLADELCRFVHRRMRVVDESPGLASAAETARSLEGDCTEHAVLLTALCRVRKIPARVAIGLVYAPAVGGFAYHMWTEVWLGEQWFPLDATRPHEPVGPAHLQLASSNLAGISPFEAFLPVLQFMGQLQLEVVSPQ